MNLVYMFDISGTRQRSCL